MTDQLFVGIDVGTGDTYAIELNGLAKSTGLIGAVNTVGAANGGGGTLAGASATVGVAGGVVVAGGLLLPLPYGPPPVVVLPPQATINIAMKRPSAITKDRLRNIVYSP